MSKSIHVLELRFFKKFENETDKSEIHFILFACRVDLFSFLFYKILELTKKSKNHLSVDLGAAGEITFRTESHGSGFHDIFLVKIFLKVK